MLARVIFFISRQLTPAWWLVAILDLELTCQEERQQIRFTLGLNLTNELFLYSFYPIQACFSQTQGLRARTLAGYRAFINLSKKDIEFLRSHLWRGSSLHKTRMEEMTC